MAGKFMRSNHDPNNILVTGADIDIDITALRLSSSVITTPTPPSSHPVNSLGQTYELRQELSHRL